MEKQQGMELVFGIHPIIELLNAKRRKIYTIYTTKPEPKAWPKILKLLPKYTKIEFISKEKLSKLADSTDHQGVVALASPFIIRKKFFNPEKEKFLLMLDSIQDPRNLGAILRSAHCTGVNGVIVTERNSTFLTPTAIKSSAGLVEHLEIYFAPNAKSAVDELKKAGYTIYVSNLENSKSALDVDFTLPCCVIIGNEGEGVSPSILKSGQSIKLPQVTADISYNASVAAGILLFLISTKNKII
ncbi:MAG: 23S rRNA (guanosine(2251)-2'-O)-methyltransferase RlmB [Candidatus Babeliales bacterium]|nr:23S rRNA (guanosine(2251)-2'-O)-methyltransferase RlmB [Candidatus Babeliales bacterium]